MKAIGKVLARFLILLLAVLPASAQAQPRMDLALCLDSSGSISDSDFQLQLDGTAAAIENPSIIPRDGSLRITVLQFHTNVTVEVPPTVIASEQHALSVAHLVRNIAKGDGSTNMSGCIDVAVDLLSGVSPASTIQVIDLSTDGQPDSTSETTLSAIAAQSAGIDVLNAIGVGDADVDFLESIVFPTPAGGGEGFVVEVEDFLAYADVIKLKIDLETAIALPIVFVHGFCSDGLTWEETIANLQDPDNVGDSTRYHTASSGTCDGKPCACDPCYHLYFDGQKVRRHTDGYAEIPQSGVYTLTFRDNSATGAAAFDLLNVNDVLIERLAYQLKRIIDEVKAVNHVSQVHVVAHSMGGLVARTLVQSLAVDAAGTVVPYDNSSIRRIVTVDTPHSGALGAAWVAALSKPPSSEAKSLACIFDSESKNRDQMIPSGGFVRGLNAREFPEQSTLVSIASTIRKRRLSFLDENDHVLSGRTQTVTTIPRYGYCASGNAGNIRSRSIRFRNILVNAPPFAILHNWVLGSDRLAQEIDQALYVDGLLFGEELRIDCRDLEAGTFEIMGDLELPYAGSTTVTLDFTGEEVPLPKDAPCNVEVRALQGGALVARKSVPASGIQVVELGDLLAGRAELGLLPACTVRLSSLGARLGEAGEPPPGASLCPTGGEDLCLSEGRFRIEVEWRDFQGNRGTAQVVPFGSQDSGLLWFFDPDNWEMLVKVLDGCALNHHFWVFAAATTNVEYTLRVTDTVTGAVRQYFNPLGTKAPAITDAEAFATCSGSAAATAQTVSRSADAAQDLQRSISRAAPKQSLCAESLTSLCLNDGRFQAEVDWEDFRGTRGSAQVVPFGSDDSGLFWFFDSGNWEMLVKILDGCGLNDRFWVFSAATTNVKYTLRVTDTWTGEVRRYRNPLGNAAPAFADTDAFATCRVAPPSHTLSIARIGTGSGTVTSVPAGIRCGSDCVETLEAGQTVSLTASAGEGSVFVGWGGDSDCLEGTVTIRADTSCVAQFDRETGYDLTVVTSGVGSGTVTSIPAGIDCGSFCTHTFPHAMPVTLSPVPDEGSMFAGWGGAGDCLDGTVTMDSDLVCTAEFQIDTTAIVFDDGEMDFAFTYNSSLLPSGFLGAFLARIDSQIVPATIEEVSVCWTRDSSYALGADLSFDVVVYELKPNGSPGPLLLRVPAVATNVPISSNGGREGNNCAFYPVDVSHSPVDIGANGLLAGVEFRPGQYPTASGWAGYLLGVDTDSALREAWFRDLGDTWSGIHDNPYYTNTFGYRSLMIRARVARP